MKHRFQNNYLHLIFIRWVYGNNYGQTMQGVCVNNCSLAIAALFRWRDPISYFAAYSIGSHFPRSILSFVIGMDYFQLDILWIWPLYIGGKCSGAHVHKPTYLSSELWRLCAVYRSGKGDGYKRRCAWPCSSFRLKFRVLIQKLIHNIQHSYVRLIHWLMLWCNEN